MNPCFKQNEEDIGRIKNEKLNISEDLARMEECVREKEERLSQLESDGEALTRRNEVNRMIKFKSTLRVQKFTYISILCHCECIVLYGVTKGYLNYRVPITTPVKIYHPRIGLLFPARGVVSLQKHINENVT